MLTRTIRNKLLTMITRSRYFAKPSSETVCDKQESPDKEIPVKVAKKSRKHVSVKSKDSSWQPDNWMEVFENIRKMRNDRTAAVDSMGAEMCYDKEAPFDKNARFQVLVSLMLSSQTKDEVTHAAMQRLIKEGLNVKNVVSMSEQQLGTIIYPVSFWKTKAKHIKKTAEILQEKYDDDIPDTVESLMELPGVGPKMTHLAMKIAWNQHTGIAVDTHVHRLSNRLAWVPKPTKTPEQTRIALEAWLPKEYWDEFNLLLVGFGQTICKPVNPRCQDCLNNRICPSSKISF